MNPQRSILRKLHMLFLSSSLTHTAGVSNLIIISQLNHFTFVSGYSCCIVISLPKFPVFSSARQVKSSVLISQPAPNMDIISCASFWYKRKFAGTGGKQIKK